MTRIIPSAAPLAPAASSLRRSLGAGLRWRTCARVTPAPLARTAVRDEPLARVCARLDEATW